MFPVGKETSSFLSNPFIFGSYKPIPRSTLIFGCPYSGTNKINKKIVLNCRI
jgi:hypothetical protein